MKILVLSPANKGVKNVVRDFMYGCWCRGRRIGGTQMPPLNLLYIATVIRQAGHDVMLVDAGLDYDQYVAIREDAREIDVVILLTSTNSFMLDAQSARELKAVNPELKTIFFGSHPTFMPKKCLEESSVDIIVRREPEFVIRDVIERMARGEDWRDVKGIGFRRGDRKVVNGYYPFIKNMDDLPAPDRSLLPAGIDYFNPVVKRMPYTTIQTSRGCPGKCNFCTVPTFFGRRIRVRSAEKVLDELRTIVDAGYKEVFFRDETFTAFKKRNKAICESILKENLDITWICNARADMVEEDQLRLMKRAGCHMVKIGVESGDQQILDNIKKGITVDQTRRAFEMCRRIGLDIHAHVMLGCIGETRETIERTFSFVQKIQPTTASFGIFTPYPGTEVFVNCHKEHPEIEDGTAANMVNLHVQGFYNKYFTQLTHEELERYVRIAYRRFYFRPRYLARRLMGMDSVDELFRWGVAASNIFSFGLRGEN